MYSHKIANNFSFGRELISISIAKGLLPHPRECDCHYTAIASANTASKSVNQFFGGYNFFSSKGIEACYDTLVCCLTAYNEPLIEYQRTISALCEGAEFFRKKGEERVSREFVICIIVDGIESISPDFSLWAKNLGIYDPSCIDTCASYHMFESQLSRNRLYSACDQDPSYISQPIDDRSLQRVILFIKSKNRGKLDSHQCFFDRVCNFYSAKYFVQIDVGTTPKEDALYKMWFELQVNPDTAATAARSLLPYPETVIDLLHTWQYCDIAVERIINWPSEVCLGSLSVLPGQLSLTRIASVIDKSSEDPDESLLDRYYRGLSYLGPFESNMYLAEDRILGQEMVFRKNKRWELSYQTDAEATVDACQSWAELCRQRRRWICSSMACRIAMQKKLPDLFKNSARSLNAKLHKLVAATYFMINSLLEWLVPGIHLIVQAALTSHSISMLSHHWLAPSIISLGVITFSSVLFQAIIAFTGKLNEVNQKIIRYSIAIQTINILFNTLVLICLNHHFLLSAGIFSAVSLYILIAYSYDKSLAKKLISTITQYMFCRLPVKAFLMTYSVFHSHDTSWGTKGLTSSVDINRPAYLQSKYERFRFFTISLFLVSNLFLFYLYIRAEANGIYFLYAAIGLLLLQLIVAFFSMLMIKVSSKRKII